MNQKPRTGDRFLVKKLFRYIPDFKAKNPKKTIIELELYEYNICVVSFFTHGVGDDAGKYKQRSKLGTGHTLAIFKACIEAVNTLEGDYAIIFSAANDIDKKEEYNARFSAYTAYLERRFKEYDTYTEQGTIKLNVKMLYPSDFKYKKEAQLFYKDFEEKTAENNF